jgi:hypothetical protein
LPDFLAFFQSHFPYPFLPCPTLNPYRLSFQSLPFNPSLPYERVQSDFSKKCQYSKNEFSTNNPSQNPVVTIHLLYVYPLYVPSFVRFIRCTIHMLYDPSVVCSIRCTMHPLYVLSAVRYIRCTVHPLYVISVVLYIRCTIHPLYDLEKNQPSFRPRRLHPTLGGEYAGQPHRRRGGEPSATNWDAVAVQQLPA